MGRINTNVQSLIARRVFGQNNQHLSQSLERLSTGLRINRGADDPAGLIASENLRAEKASIATAIGNAERAEQVVNIAEGGLQEVSNLLVELEGLVTQSANSAGLSEEELDANQLQVDSILQTIDRVAGSTSFQGKKLLNGSLDYNATNVNAAIEDFHIQGAKFNSSTYDVDIVVTGSAQQGALFLSTGSILNLGGSAATDGASSALVLEIAGVQGSRELSFGSGTAIADIIAAVNSFSDVTGVSATTEGTGIRLDSTELGSSQFVSVKVVDDGAIFGSGLGVFNFASSDVNTVSAASVTAFSAANNGIRDAGQDVAATINGVKAVSRGAQVSVNTDFLATEIELSPTGAQTTGSITAFTITGGGADFQLASNVDISGKVSLGIQNIAVRALGRTERGDNTYSLSDLADGEALNVQDESSDLVAAQRVLRGAIKEVNSLRGRLGAFQKNIVGATIRSLGVSLENTTAAESKIRDADFAAETAELTRTQILTNANTNIIGIANQQPQQALQLLG